VINSFSGEYSFLSNFYQINLNVIDVQLGPILVRSVEHGFQADKTLIASQRRQILESPSAKLAKAGGRKATLRPDWKQVKIASMYNWLSKKFAIPELKEKLLATGVQTLVEGNTWGDTFWGVCDGKGQNNLGKLLMELREQLRGT